MEENYKFADLRRSTKLNHKIMEKNTCIKTHHKFLKICGKKKILKEVGIGEDITYREMKIKMTAGFLSDIMQAKRQWSNFFKVLISLKKKKTFNLEFFISKNIFRRIKI